MLRRIINKIKKHSKKPEETAFFTKDIFKGKKFIIGDFTYGHPNILFENEDANLIIGKYCSIAKNVTIFLGGNHRPDWITTYPFNDLPKYFPNANSIKGHPATKGDVIIGNDVWIGYNVIVLSGVKISDGAILAAGSVLTKNVGPYEIWGGNPAKFIRKRFEQETIDSLLEIKWWDLDDKKVTKYIPLLQQTNVELINKLTS